MKKIYNWLHFDVFSCVAWTIRRWMIYKTRPYHLMSMLSSCCQTVNFLFFVIAFGDETIFRTCSATG